MQSSLDGMRTVCEVVAGPDTVIDAIAGGKRTAEAIPCQMWGLWQAAPAPVPMRCGRIPQTEPGAAGKMEKQRPQMPLLNMIRRKVMFRQVELGDNVKTAQTEAGRCLRRDDVCIRCDICARTVNCPAGAIRVEYRGEERYLEYVATQTAKAKPKAVQSLDCPVYDRTAWSRIAPERLAFQ